MVLFTGDFSRHEPHRLIDPWNNVTDIVDNGSKIIDGVFESLAKRGLVSVGTLGNDDTPRNYEINITTDLEKNPWISSIADRFVEDGIMTEPNAEQYSYGGFYETTIGSITLLTIDTLIYSTGHQPKVNKTEDLPKDPFNQFAWLRGRLTAAASENRMVWIIGHIPPGLETWGYSNLWFPLYLQAYLDIVQDPLLGSVIAAQLFAHTHTDEFRVLPSAPEGAGPILITNAVSPIYDNHPGFRVVEYDPVSSRPLSYSVYFARLDYGATELEFALGYTSTEIYPDLAEAVAEEGHLSMKGFQRLRERLSEESGTYATFTEWYKTQRANDLNSDRCMSTVTAQADCAKTLACAFVVSDEPAFEGCAGLPSRDGDFAKVSNELDRRKYDALRDSHWSRVERLRAKDTLAQMAILV
jgi:hypothetical protein